MPAAPVSYLSFGGFKNFADAAAVQRAACQNKASASYDSVLARADRAARSRLPMIDPLPLTQDGATPFEVLLISAGRSDALSAQSRARIHLGLGLSGGVLAAAATTAALKATAAKSVLSSVLASSGTVAVIGAVSALALFLGARSLLPANVGELESRSQPVSVDERRFAPAASVHVVTPAVDQPPIAEAKLADARPSPRLPGASLADELRLIEEARSANARHEHALALRLLDAYAQRFPKQSLRSEATLLRIESLAASGATDAARQLGKTFLARHPNGPYARRVRSLLADSAPTATDR
jgi:hypothetical protein